MKYVRCCCRRDDDKDECFKEAKWFVPGVGPVCSHHVSSPRPRGRPALMVTPSELSRLIALNPRWRYCITDYERQNVGERGGA